MKLPKDFDASIEEILKRDPRYLADAYPFILAALDHTLDAMGLKGKRRHITGQEFLEGIRSFAWSQFGPMTRSVLSHWGIQRTRDFGDIVFNMVEAGLMGKTEEDSIDDFDGGYGFDEAFGKEPDPDVIEA